MPIIKSAKKRVKVAAKANAKNLRSKRTLRASVRDLKTALAGGNSKTISDKHRKAQSEIDKAVKKHLMHKRKAARKKAQLSLQAKTSVKKTPAKKPVAKKTVKK
ncbi:MAG TPA: 30S ribosomal protein S20 [Candidatus Saccharimonadales bacterium]|jgi:small subunit ribosomal protein S20|nr:30S ribosomal protein S20 [Candidatus Saccharimonadales bacterium]